MKPPQYHIIEDGSDRILIQDVGPWNRYMTITNGAEIVVAELAPRLNGRRLEYIDSEGDRGQLLVKACQFAGFAPVGRSNPPQEPTAPCAALDSRDFDRKKAPQ